MIHALKTIPIHFMGVSLDDKKVEIRKDDRGFKGGDLLVLREWNGKNYTGRVVLRVITHILRDFVGLSPGYVALSVRGDAELIKKIKINYDEYRDMHRRFSGDHPAKSFDEYVLFFLDVEERQRKES